MGNIEKRHRKNGETAFILRWMDKQTRERKSHKFDNEHDARRMLLVLEAHAHDTERAVENVRKHYEAVYTVSDMVEDHIELLTDANGYTVHKYSAMQRNHIDSTIGSASAVEADYRDVVRWVKELQRKGLAPKTIANVHGLLSASFKSAVRLKKRADNPCQGVTLPRDNRTEETISFLTRKEWELLQSHIEDHYRPLFTFLAATGTRFGEATALYARDFTDVDNGVASFSIVRAWTYDDDNRPILGPPKTRKSKRTITIASETVNTVAESLLRSRATGNHLFSNSTGGPIDHRRAWESWDRTVKAAQQDGLLKRPRIHDLRHSNASWLLQAGLDIYKLQMHLGHESITTTIDRYSHLLPEGAAEIAAAMQRAFAS
ncbi:tyrosine-type recombinase/integrase [Arthrobacter sp. Soil782]|uniref:tyrosine-type recombinase/integrase n=1 Tax=Arthrobacter sp. Soil782 TaxID=1736410 RepID=UPI00138F8795|nr:site-specific integrase [Arthrobacter sp. Soil782]